MERSRDNGGEATADGREGLYMACFLQGFLMDVWAFPCPSCIEEEQEDSFNAQRLFELMQPIFFILGKCRQGNFPCRKSDFPFDPAASPIDKALVAAATSALH